jgi:hypothetical protein
MNVRVVNAMKDRSKCMRRTPSGSYEFGWLVYNRRDREKDYFIRAGEGTMADAEAWMTAVDEMRPRRRRVVVQFKGSV